MLMLMLILMLMFIDRRPKLAAFERETISRGVDQPPKMPRHGERLDSRPVRNRIRKP